MAKQQMSSEDALRRQARRRLIGAVALVTAVVVILPMVLDREPKPTGQNIELRIPDKDKAGEFTSQMVLPEENAPESAPESAPAVATKPAEITAVKPPAVTTRPVKKKPAETKPAETKPIHKAAPAAKPAPKPAPVAQSNPAPAKAGFAVQVGAFANADSARELRDKLSKQGWSAYTEKAGDKVRVRVGPYTAREAAENVQHKLEAQDLHPVVVSVP